MKGAYRVLIAAFVVAMMAWSASAAMVTFQVDMTVQEALGNFDAGTHQLVVRGTFNDWSGNADMLTLNGAIYTYTRDIAAGDIEYKFVIIGGASDVWENVANRTATVGTEALVLDVVFFDDINSAESADVEVNFRVDMEIQELTGNFDPEVDWVVVRGGHPNLGNWGGAVQLTEETGEPGVYSAWIEFDNLPIPDVAVEYKFVILIGGEETNATWESNDNRSFIPTGDEPDLLPPPSGDGYGEIVPALVNFSNIGPEDIITSDLNVVFRVEVTPLIGRITDEGFVYDVQTGDTIYSIESIEAAGYFNNWPWGNFSPDHTLNDDGVNGDETSGDNVFSGTILFPAGSPRQLIYKYGANMLDVEAGFARNHERTLDDSEETFVMDIDCWGSPDTLYAGWDCIISSTDEPGLAAPTSYSLAQNFPNPFNSSTTISFSLPIAEMAKLSIFDILGRQVSVMDFGRLNAGTHNIEFNAGSFASGVYFYKLETANYTATKKMLLMK
ncbi:T9SS type A sorting domain-containing protein [bacterium]|nr:T9SS type A sorting domain-containing protein [bacterium]